MTRTEYLKQQITAIMPDVANCGIDWESIWNSDEFYVKVHSSGYFHKTNFTDCGLALDYLKENEATLQNAILQAMDDYEIPDLDACVLANCWASRIAITTYNETFDIEVENLFLSHEYQALELDERLNFLAEKHSKERNELISEYHPEVFNELQRAGLLDTVEEIKNMVSEFYDSENTDDEVTK